MSFEIKTQRLPDGRVGVVLWDKASNVGVIWRCAPQDVEGCKLSAAEDLRKEIQKRKQNRP